MARTPGARNRDHDATKIALATRVLGAIVRHGGQPSLHEMAREAETSIPTLKHYFGNRSGVAAAALRTVREAAAEHTGALADPAALPVAESLVQVGEGLAAAWVPHGVGRLFAAGMAAGMFDDAVGPGYLEGVLEPTVLALEARMRVHAARGEMRFEADDDFEVRAAALAFISPLLLALLHQHALSGARCRPLDVNAFVHLHAARFVAAYGLPRPPSASPPVEPPRPRPPKARARSR